MPKNITNNGSQRFLKYRAKIVLITVLVVFLILSLISIIVCYNLIHPKRKEIDFYPQTLEYEEVVFQPVTDELDLKGWFLPAEESTDRTVILSHGYGGNRLDKFPVTSTLVKNNFNVLVFDFRNSGESATAKTTIGQHEKKDLLGAIKYIKERFHDNHNIGLLGYSMGAATAALTAAESSEVQAVVMDSSFADLEPYLKENLPVWSGLPAFPFNFFILNIGTRIFNLSPGKVRPIKAVEEIDCPIFFIHGQNDHEIPVKNVMKLYEQSGHPEDRLWRVPEAGHVEAADIDFENYIEKVVDFFDKSL